MRICISVVKKLFTLTEFGLSQLGISAPNKRRPPPVVWAHGRIHILSSPHHCHFIVRIRFALRWHSRKVTGGDRSISWWKYGKVTMHLLLYHAAAPDSSFTHDQVESSSRHTHCDCTHRAVSVVACM
jgi:hypothetical protein